MTRLLQAYLYILAKLVLWRHRPRIIAVTGNVGKTSTKEAIFAVLSRRFSVRRGDKNYNNEIGVPLTILEWPHHGRNVILWLWELKSFLRTLIISSYPEILVLEMGADHPGDIRYLANLARPDIAVITGVGDVPVHVEFFGTPEALANEKAEMLRALPFSGYAVLNADDPRVLSMRKLTNASITTYGTSEGADYSAEHPEIRFRSEGEITVPDGISFKVANKGSVVPVRLIGSLSLPQVLSATAAFAVGRIMGMNAVEVSDALLMYQPPPGRLRLLYGHKQSLVLDDTYNAAPAAMESALETLKTLPARRRIAVLGDMLELGAYTEEAHRKIGRLAASVCDAVFLVGDRMKCAEEELMRAGFDQALIQYMNDAREVAAVLEPMVRAGDLILIKGSQGMRMERAVEDIMAEPERAGEFLVRQSAEWKAKI